MTREKGSVVKPGWRFLVFAAWVATSTGHLPDAWAKPQNRQEPTAPPLTLQLDPTTRLTLPAPCATQTITEVRRMDLGADLDDAVLVGLNCFGVEDCLQAHVLVYAKRQEAMALVADLPLHQYFESFDQALVNGQPVLIINGASGAHAINLSVYRFTGGRPELLFDNGSAAGAEVRHTLTNPEPVIWIGIENWNDPHWSYVSGEPLWNVYTWNGQAFVYNQQLSTAPETSWEERTARYVRGVQDTMRQLDAPAAGGAAANPGR